jgi:nucleotide-binding universal stress UspA family protein
LVSAEGPLTQVLQEHAGTADILVVGNRRTRAIRSILAGASALRIAATSSVPTVLVSDDTSGGQGAVVLGVAADGSSEGARAFAVEEAKRSGTALEIVHAWGPPAASETLGFPDRPAEVVAEHRIVLETAAHQIRSDWPELDVRDYLVGDEPADALVARAARASLVVIGTRGLDPVTGIIRDSIGHAVSARSRTPLCIVPAPWRPR